MPTAKFMKQLDGWNGDAGLYLVDPPMNGNDYVVVSAVFATDTGRPETYVFPATDAGCVKSWNQLDCSRRGVFSHDEILSGAGYERT